MIARAGIMVLALLGGAAAVFAQDRIHLHTNETEIGEVLRDGGVSLEDPLAVFGVVLKNLPERVQVYPTENYFYFRFNQKGTVYVGNIRLAAADPDELFPERTALPQQFAACAALVAESETEQP